MISGFLRTPETLNMPLLQTIRQLLAAVIWFLSGRPPSLKIICYKTTLVSNGCNSFWFAFKHKPCTFWGESTAFIIQFLKGAFSFLYTSVGGPLSIPCFVPSTKNNKSNLDLIEYSTK
jgi:hypothetical protein